MKRGEGSHKLGLDIYGSLLIHEVAQWLISQNRSFLSKVNNNGLTPLHAAAQEGNMEMVKWLVSQDPQQINARTKNGETPYKTAMQNNHSGVASWLQEKYPKGCIDKIK